MTDLPINGLVLAGGRSSRMGENKSELRYYDKPQREHLVDVLSPFCEEVFISCRPKELMPDKLKAIPDHFEIQSPLNGILSAFRLKPDSAWLSVPVDMPWIDREVIQFLVKNRNRDRIATCFLDSTGKNPEPLLTLWEPTAGMPLLHYYQDKGFSPREFLLTQPVHTIRVPDPKYLVNINTPEDWSQFRKDHPGDVK
jgi:molybdopterin-guanine dinucleotide biosynthesis protein A